MASGGVGSDTVYRGTVDHVSKGYGFIRLQNANPVARAFFDRSSLLNRRIEDLTEEFSKGCQVKACVVLTDGDHKVKFKAVKLRLSSKPAQKPAPTLTPSHEEQMKSILQNFQSQAISSDTVYRGTVDHVTKSYGFIVLQNANPVPRAFFDQSSLLNGRIDDLSKEYTKGSQVKACIVPTDGEHKVKFKAVKLRLSGKPAQKPASKSKSSDGEYLKSHLQNGAVLIERLAENPVLKALITSSANNAKVWDESEIMKIVSLHSNWFLIRNGFVCLRQKEDNVISEILEEMETYNNKIPFDAMTAIIPPEHEDRRYLHSPDQWNVGIKDFVSRNCAKLVYWDEHIWSKKHLISAGALNKAFQKDLLAVLYYSQFVITKGPIAIRSLSGHFNQATEEVKEVCSPKESEFRKFLERNAFFFILQGDMVKECPSHRILCISNSWLSKKSRKSSSGSKPAPKPRRSSGPQSPRACPVAPPFEENVKVPVQVSKAFSDMEEESCSRKASPLKVKNPCSSYTARVGSEIYTPGSASLLESAEGYSAETSSSGLYSSPDANVFKNLVGEDISRAVEEEIVSSHTLNSLLLLRLNVGKPPMASFRIPGERKGLKHDMKLQPSKPEDIQRILRRNEVIKSDASSHYGVKGTLHSILTRELGGKVDGLTLFCQLHEDSDGIDLDMLERRNFTAVFTGSYPDKCIYNYLRSKCRELSKNEDVLVIDVNGQLSGCNEKPHPSLGNVTRINCKSSTDLTPLINESIHHMHGFMITIQVESQDHLLAIQRMRNQETHVFAAVSSDMKTEVEKIFS